MEDIRTAVLASWDECKQKCVLSKPRMKDSKYKKIVITAKQDGYQIERFTQTQAFHENVRFEQTLNAVLLSMATDFLQLNSWDGEYEYLLRVTKKGTVLSSRRKLKGNAVGPVKEAHNKQKAYLLRQGEVIPPLVDMGIFTKEGKAVQSMYDKYRQINRFLEIIDDEVKQLNTQKQLTILDFGCGKSYLTFVLYYYFTEIRRLNVRMIGVDLKEEVIAKCNQAAKKYGYENLTFEVGDISKSKLSFDKENPLDIMITLHACDTATDYALYNAIQWNTRMIFSVPCCQHELNNQIKSDSFAILTRYGIVKERVSALMTDAIRGNLLRHSGYKTQLLEFVDINHTPKNIMIKAIKGGIPKSPHAIKEVRALVQEFNLSPTLYRLLGLDKQ